MDQKEKLVFGVATTESGVPIITLGISQAAWEYMKEGKTHTLDLTKLGIAAQIVLFGGDTYDSISETITTGLKERGIAVDDQRGKGDYGVKI